MKESSTIPEFGIVQNEGGREVGRDTKFYNLDMILAIGYHVRPNVGMQFRNWTSKILKEYMQKGFVMNDERLENPKKFGEDYFDELLERIRDINISKNYLQEDEITDLNPIVTMFLDHAEDMARGKTYMTMKDWDNSLNEFLQFRRREILEGKGKVSREDIERKVLQEYATYNTRGLNTPSVDEMIDGIPEIEK